jgi:hypothetical protein
MTNEIKCFEVIFKRDKKFIKLQDLNALKKLNVE